MKIAWLGLVALLALPLRAEEPFLPSLTTDERAALGLHKLSADELARLEAAVQRFKSGEVAVVRTEAEKKVAAAEARLQGERENAGKEERKKNYWAVIFGEVDPKGFEFQTTLPGDFQSFEGKPTFKLANGQQWRTIQDVHYVCGHALHDPQVSVKPGALSAFWLEIEHGPRIKVVPVKRDWVGKEKDAPGGVP